jgi:hypothetical protein
LTNSFANYRIGCFGRAQIERVWAFFEDLEIYVRKFEPHTLSIEITPPGQLSLGQKIHAFVDAGGGRKVEVFSEITELIPEKKLVETHLPNNFFKKLVETVTLEEIAAKEGIGSIRVSTLIKFNTYYELNGIRPTILSWLFASRTMSRNFAISLNNLKAAIESSSAEIETK